MKFFSECNDCENCLINYIGTCLAGHGDNDFILITILDAQRILYSLEDRNKKNLLKKFPSLIYEMGYTWRILNLIK